MATVSTLTRDASVAAQKETGFVALDIDLAAAATAKGSALAASDIIQAISLDGPCIVKAAGLYCKTTPAGGTGTVFDLGVTGGDPDFFVDGFAFDSATAGDYATATGNANYVLGSDDTLDVLIQAGSTVSTSGVVTVWAQVEPLNLVDGRRAPSVVDRDTLA